MTRHVLVNGLSISGGGGYTVGRELTRHLALARPDHRFTLLLTESSPLHEPLRSEAFPPNVTLHWSPPATASLRHRVAFERAQLPTLVRAQNVHGVIQLNGMIVRALPVPTLSHNQDPVPFRPEAWSHGVGGLKYRVIAALKRRAVRTALTHAACYGWTSHYLRTLITGATGITPKRDAVFYNAVPEEWVTRTTGSAAASLPPLASRGNQLLCVSNVTEHKRQHMIIEAVAEMHRRGLTNVTARIIGKVFSEPYEAQMRARLQQLGLTKAVTIEGKKSDAEVEAAFKQSRCFVFMSVCESFGIPPLEAMSFGTPVVASDCCAMPEVCDQAADYAPMDNQPALNDAVYRVLTDATHANTLRERGLARVPHFRWPKTAAQMATHMDAMLGDA